MVNWRIDYTAEAAQHLMADSVDHNSRLLSVIKRLQEQPVTPNSTLIQEYPKTYGMEAEGCQIVYVIDNQLAKITVTVIEPLDEMLTNVHTAQSRSSNFNISLSNPDLVVGILFAIGMLIATFYILTQ